MELQARVIEVHDEVTGTSKSGKQWRRRDYVLETLGQYPKKVHVSCFNTAIENCAMQRGLVYTVQLDAESREWNGKWYTSLTAWGIKEKGGQQPPQQTRQTAAYTPPAPPAANDPFEDAADKLPF